jgi:4-hydroxy-tetrahydrodipicolinate synthase
MIKGAYTALTTPFDGDSIDFEGLDALVDFQIQNGISGILAVGTTGESPTLNWEEHIYVIEKVAKRAEGKCMRIAGTGSNNTRESLDGTKHAVEVGADAVLLVDPYYNGPSSLEIRREYVEPIAAAFPKVQIIPYVIPGRSGTQLLPEDIGLLNEKYENVNTVKEATGNLENMKRTRKCCRADFSILSGDDGITYDMMTDHQIDAAGVISVMSNVIPKSVSELVESLLIGDKQKAQKILYAVGPLFDLVNVSTMEKTPFGDVLCKARNPVPVKTLMAVLGMPSGGCRRPLGKMTKQGLDKVIAAARKTETIDKSVFAPIADFFGVDIEDRLNNPKHRAGLIYGDY